MKLRPCSAVLLAALLAVSLRAAELNVFAAASLSDVLKEIATKYEAASGEKLRLNLAASSVLARQIKEGAPADVFFSADEAKMDDLAKAGLLAPDTRVSLLSNTLVIVVPADSKVAIPSPAALASPAVTKLALAEPATVPAGIYAKAHLQKLGLWEAVAPKVIPTENVRACLAAVESANVDAGIVYRTDALASKQSRVAYEIPVVDGPKITYPLAVLKDSRSSEAAHKFATYLASADAKAIFVKYGFVVPR